ncbi:hypothetical protein Tco_0002167 [Tanacetum coccineum]
MGDEHLDTIPATESDEVIKSSVEDLVPILSESEGIPDSVCDMPLCNNPTPLEAFKDHYEIVVDSNDDSSLSDDDSYEDIEYVNASPPDAEIVSLEVVEIVIPKVGGIDDDILLTIKDDILREKLLNVNLLIANIEALKDNPTPSFDVMTKSSSTFPNFFLEETNTFDNSLPEYETFCFDLEENSSGSTDMCTDKAKIPRKRLKPGKLEHGNGRARKKPGRSYQNQTLVKPWSILSSPLPLFVFCVLWFIVQDCSDSEASYARDFVLRSQEL